MAAKKPKYDVPSLKTGFQILEHLSHYPRGRVLTDITESLKCPVSSAYRITMALEDMELVTRDPETKQIRLTNKLLQIGQMAITETNLVEHSLDVMRELRNKVEDTVLIGVREGNEVIVLDEAIGNRMFCFISKLGYRISVSCSAPGKTIIAFLPESEQAQIINSIQFIQYNERTITTKAGLRKELSNVVKNGYSFDDSEQFEGIYCVGAPIFDRSGYPVSSVWVTGLMMNIKRKDIPEIGRVVRLHADRISARMGYLNKGNH